MCLKMTKLVIITEEQSNLQLAVHFILLSTSQGAVRPIKNSLEKQPSAEIDILQKANLSSILK